MTDKCTKYEALFTFGSDETFKQHLETCEDCKKVFEAQSGALDFVIDKINKLS